MDTRDPAVGTAGGASGPDDVRSQRRTRPGATRRALGALAALALLVAPAAPQTIAEIIDATGDGMGNGVSGAFAVAVDAQDRAYVASRSTDSVFRIDPGGAVTRIVDATGDGLGNGLDDPRGLALDAAGNLFVSGCGSNNVLRVTPQGAVSMIVDASGDGTPQGELACPVSLAVDAAGNVYVAGESSFNVLRVTPQGAVTRVLDVPGGPYGLAVDAAGNLFASSGFENRVYKRTPGGQISVVLDVADGCLMGEFCLPDDVAVDGMGNLYAAGVISMNVLRVTPAGATTEIIDASGDGQGNVLDGATGLAVDALCNVYVTGSVTDNVFRIGPTGIVTEVLDASGDGAGNTLDGPIGVAVSSGGDVYVTGDSSHNAFVLDVPALDHPVVELAEINAPVAVAVDAAGNAFVVTWTPDAVFKVPLCGEVTQILDASGDGQGNTLSLPEDIAVDDAGNAYVTGLFSNNVFKITPDGQVTEILDATGDGLGNVFSVAGAVAVDGAGNVYAGGLTSRNVFKITTAGQITEIIDESGDGLGNVLDGPTGLAVDAAGNVYVAANPSDNVFRITPGGQITEIIDASGDGAGHVLTTAIDVTVDGLGNAYVQGHDSDNVFRITAGGAITQIMDAAGDGLGGPLDAPTNIEADASGNVYVCGNLSHNIFWISPGGAITQILDAGGDGLGNALTGPVGVATDGAGRVWVAGTSSHNVFLVHTSAASPPQQPLAPSVAAIAGRSGRATAALSPPPPPGAGDAFYFQPVVVMPKTDEDKIEAQLADVQETTVSFSHPTGGQIGEFATGDGPVMTHSADFDGDGGDDVITANQLGGTLSFLASDADPGDPAFEAQVEIALPSDGGTVAVAGADFDGDLLLDLVAAGDGGVTVFLATAPGVFGGGAFTAVNAPDPSFHTDLATGDHDGDGDPDVITTSGALGPLDGFFTVLENTAGALSVVGTESIGQPVVSVLMGDFDDTDAMGFDDALVVVHLDDADPGPGIVPGAHVRLYVSNGDGTFTLSPGAFTGNANLVTDVDGVVPSHGASGDIDNDGDLDAIFTSAESLAYAPGTFGDEYPAVELLLLLNDGAGGFAVSHVATGYAGKGISPLLQDLAPVPSEPGGPFLDAVLVWYSDANAGLPGGEQLESFLTALLWDDELGTFVDASPNHFLAGDEPGNGAVGELHTAAASVSIAPDVVVPNSLQEDFAGALTVFVNDGSGVLTPSTPIGGLSDLDPEASHPTGTWQGGPRELLLADVDGDSHLDAIVYTEFEDISGLSAFVPASLSVHLGDGLGGFPTRSSYLEPARGGEIAAGHLNGDGYADVVLTQRRGARGDEEIRVYTGAANGALTLAQTVPLRGGALLTGGLALADVDGDGDRDLVTTVDDGGAESLAVVKDPATAPQLALHPLAATWIEVRSVALADVTGDGRLDALVGIRGGALALAQGTATGGFTSKALPVQAAAVGGGAVTVADVTGDGRPDVLSSNRAEANALDQAFVRMLRGLGGGGFEVVVLPGLSSVGASGSLRPLLADMDDDGATDTVLVHGGAANGSVSVQRNQLSRFEVVGVGKAPAGEPVPSLRGRGYTTPGGAIELVVSDAAPGALGLLVAAGAHGVAVGEPLGLGAAFAVPASGSVTLSGQIPADPVLLGATPRLRVVLGKPTLLQRLPLASHGGGLGIAPVPAAAPAPAGAAPGPAVKVSSTNALEITIVSGS